MGVCKPASSQGIPDSNGIRGRQHGFDCGHDASVVEHPNLAFGELGFEPRHELADVYVDLPHRQRPDVTIRRLSVHRRDVVCIMQRSRFTRRRDLNRANEVEPQAYEVEKVVTRERFATHVRVHETKSTKASFGRAQTSDVRKHEPLRVTDDDVVDLSRAMHERTDLPPRLDAREHERAKQLLRADVGSGHAPPIDALESLRCRRRKTRGVAVEFDERLPETNLIEIGRLSTGKST